MFIGGCPRFAPACASRSLRFLGVSRYRFPRGDRRNLTALLFEYMLDRGNIMLLCWDGGAIDPWQAEADL